VQIVLLLSSIFLTFCPRTAKRKEKADAKASGEPAPKKQKAAPKKEEEEEAEVLQHLHSNHLTREHKYIVLWLIVLASYDIDFKRFAAAAELKCSSNAMLA
jgi:hypothetical protein